MELKGRIISKGTVQEEALVTSQPISFYGGVDPNTGEIIEKLEDRKCVRLSLTWTNQNEKLVAEGTAEHPVVLTSWYDDDHGGDRVLRGGILHCVYQVARGKAQATHDDGHNQGCGQYLATG